jgi:hypothetical protein
MEKIITQEELCKWIAGLTEAKKASLTKPKAICLLRPQIQPYPIRRKAQRVRLGVVGQVQRLALAPILIDGCAVPRILYDRIKAQALATGKTQCVGVICNVPARPQSERFSLMDIFEPPALFAALRSGEHSVFVIDQTCEELHARRDLAMILYFSPFGE